MYIFELLVTNVGNVQCIYFEGENISRGWFYSKLIKVFDIFVQDIHMSQDLTFLH